MLHCFATMRIRWGHFVLQCHSSLTFLCVCVRLCAEGREPFDVRRTVRRICPTIKVLPTFCVNTIRAIHVFYSCLVTIMSFGSGSLTWRKHGVTCNFLRIACSLSKQSWSTQVYKVVLINSYCSGSSSFFGWNAFYSMLDKSLLEHAVG